ncbi:unnamed protein product, partial [Notodromas monacha]
PPPKLPPTPLSLKPILHSLKAATEYDVRDPVVSYWCRFYSAQAALKLDRTSPEARAILLPLMDWLEMAKKVMKGDEAISNEVVAQAHVENAAWTLFSSADTQDRASVFNKNVVKQFYTSGVLYDVLTTFGELTEENFQQRKYAKWKAAYIHNALKNGETPIPGPMADEDGEFAGLMDPSGATGGVGHEFPQHPPPPLPAFHGSMDGSGGGGGGYDLLTGDRLPTPAQVAPPPQPVVPAPVAEAGTVKALIEILSIAHLGSAASATTSIVKLTCPKRKHVRPSVRLSSFRFRHDARSDS